MDKNIFRQISYGMYFVSTIDKNNKKVGCIINTLTQITSENPLISINLNKNNYTNTAIKDTKKFIVSIISEKTKPETIKTFGYQTSKETEKFKNINHELYENLPIILEDTIGYLVLETKQVIDCNTHDIIIAKVIDTKTLNDNYPMTYQFYHKVLKGTSPKNAPTFIKETNTHSKSKQYQCQICGHIYDDAKEDIKFEDLPEDWICPICGVTKDNFKRIS